MNTYPIPSSLASIGTPRAQLLFPLPVPSDEPVQGKLCSCVLKLPVRVHLSFGLTCPSISLTLWFKSEALCPCLGCSQCYSCCSPITPRCYLRPGLLKTLTFAEILMAHRCLKRSNPTSGCLGQTVSVCLHWAEFCLMIQLSCGQEGRKGGARLDMWWCIWTL